MFCLKCGSEIPNDALYCPKCGAKQGDPEGKGGGAGSKATVQQAAVIAEPSVIELKCPGCGAPIKPEFGEMVISCEYCGTSVALQNMGWRNVTKHTMMPLMLQSRDQALSEMREELNRGIFRIRIAERSTIEEMNLRYVPYWIVPVSARTNYTAEDVAVEVGKVAATAAIIGLASGGMSGGRNRSGRGLGIGQGLLGGAMIGSMMGGGQNIRSYTINKNYNYPVVAVKALTQYQPREYSFDLSKRAEFEESKLPKGVNVLNGDIGMDAAKYEAKTNVDQLQATLAHSEHHMVRSIETECDVSDPELMHVPNWFAKFRYKKESTVVIVDATTGKVINRVEVG